MIIINESPNSLINLRKKTFYKDNIKFISTIGFLNDYFFMNDAVEETPRIEEIVNEIKNIKNEVVVIATDLDDAGNFIALEILEILDKSNTFLRLNKHFEYLSEKETLEANYIKEASISKINIDSAKRYWKKMNFENLRLEIINYILEEKKEIEVIK